MTADQGSYRRWPCYHEFNMKIGPFSALDIREVETILHAHDVKYQIVFDKSSSREQEKRLGITSGAPAPYSTLFGVPLFIYVEIDKSAVLRLGNALEKYGVAALSTGEELLGPPAGSKIGDKREPLWRTAFGFVSAFFRKFFR